MYEKVGEVLVRCVINNMGYPFLSAIQPSHQFQLHNLRPKNRLLTKAVETIKFQRKMLNNCFIKEIILTKFQHDDLFSMIKGDWASVKKTGDQYRVRASDEEEFRSWRFKRIPSKNRIELWRYTGNDYELPKDQRVRDMQLAFRYHKGMCKE